MYISGFCIYPFRTETATGLYIHTNINIHKEDRKARLNNALGIIKRLAPADYKNVTGMLSFSLGVSDQKAREYVRVLRDSGWVVVEMGTVDLPKGGGRHGK